MEAIPQGVNADPEIFRPFFRISRGFLESRRHSPLLRVMSIMITAECEDHTIRLPEQLSVLMFLESFGHEHIMQASCLRLHRFSDASIPRVMRNKKLLVKVLTHRAEHLPLRSFAERPSFLDCDR